MLGYNNVVYDFRELLKYIIKPGQFDCISLHGMWQCNDPSNGLHMGTRSQLLPPVTTSTSM